MKSLAKVMKISWEFSMISSKHQYYLSDQLGFNS